MQIQNFTVLYALIFITLTSSDAPYDKWHIWVQSEVINMKYFIDNESKTDKTVKEHHCVVY